MKFLILFFLTQISQAQVPHPSSEVWALGTKYYPFARDKETKALISIKCLKEKKCDAYKAILNKSKIQLSEVDRSGGKNPGAVVCKKFYEGEVLVLRDSAENENAFCQFKDKSLASASDLF